MRGNPLIDFHRAAEAAGYPALLIVSLVCLGLVIAPIALLALTQAMWALALALLMLIAAVAILAVEIDAAISDYGEPAASRTSVGAAAPHELERSRHCGEANPPRMPDRTGRRPSGRVWSQGTTSPRRIA